MNKVLIVLLALVVTAGLFAGGAKDDKAAGMARELTIWEELWGNASVSVPSLAETPVYKQAMANTGINVTWIHPPQGQVTEHFNLMIASNDFPDMIYYSWNNYPGGPEKAISDGVITKINDLIEKKAPNLMARFKEHPEWLKAAKTDSGTMYHFPFIRGHEDLMTFYGPQTRKDWLDKLGLERPETLDEWEAMLTAYKEAGLAEYPLTMTKLKRGRGLSGQNDNTSHGNAFIQPFGITWHFYQDDDGRIHFGPYEDAFKDFLVFFKGWYDKGLVDPEIFSNERKTFDAKVVNGDAGAWVSYTGSGIGAYLDANRGKNAVYDIVPLKYPVINKGDMPFFTQMDLAVKTQGMAVTTQAKDPDLCAEWADYAYGAEGHKLFNFGIEGESYEWRTDYAGFEGEKFPVYTDLMMKNPDGKTLSQMGGLYTRAFYSGPIVQDEHYIYQYAHRPAQREAIKIWGIGGTADHRIPGITPTPEESEDFGAIMAEVKTYREEMVVKFITGQVSIDKFADFQAQLKKMGVERTIEIQQAGLNRYNAR